MAEEDEQQEQLKEAAAGQYLDAFFQTLSARGYPQLAKDASLQEKAIAAAQKIDEQQEKQAKRVRPVIEETCEDVLDSILDA